MADDRSVFSFRYAVFDNDGTLVDTMRQCGDIFADLVAPFGIDRVSAREFYFSSTGRPMPHQFGEILAEIGVKAEQAQVADMLRQFNSRFLREDADVFPGVPYVLKTLGKRIERIFLSSAASDACVWKRLNDNDIAKHFTLAYGSTAVPKGPKHLAIFAEVAGLSMEDFAANAFFCGDGEADMRIARDAGLYAIGVRGTVSDERLANAGAQRIIGSVTDLIDDEGAF